MTNFTRHSLHLATLGPLAAALALLASGAARAEPNPYYIGAVAEYGHESNVFRQSKKLAKADSYTSLGLIAGLDQPIGRQRLYASARVNSRRYQDLDVLNHVNYGITAGVDWATIERLSGNLNVSLDQNLEDPAVRVQAQQDRILARREALSFRAQYGLVSLWSLDGTLSHRRSSFNVPDSAPKATRDYYATNELTQDSVGAGVKYRPSGALTLGAGLRFTRGKYTNDSFDRNDLDLTANWIATGQSTLNARLSASRVRYDGATERDVSGLTGSLGWTYRPTGKLAFNTLISRDTGAETSQIDGALATYYGDDSRLSTALSVSASYEATAKIRVNALGRYIRRSLVDYDSARAAGEQYLSGHDRVKGLTVGVTYAVARSVQLGCNVGRESRGVSGNLSFANGAGQLSSAYSVDTYSCSAQFTLQ